MKNASHTWVICFCALTHSAACHLSSKKETHEVVICVFTQVWVSVFSCIYTFTCPFSPLIHTHTPFTPKPIPILTHTFPGVVLTGRGCTNGLEQACFLVRVKLWPGLKGSSHSIPPEVPLVWDPFEPPPAERTSLQIHCSSLSEHCGGEPGHYVKVNTAGSVHSLYWGFWGWPPLLDHVE